MERQHLSQTKNAIAPPQTQSHAIDRYSPHPIEELQGAIGNQAVNKFLVDRPTVQAKPMFRGLSGELRSPTPLQAKPAKEADRPSVSEVQTENKTGLPDRLKAGVENYSGLAMDDVKVHYNSSKPSELQALAYTQGTDIHVAPGQETHLPHEAWHVVQQKQGRVKPTIQAKGVGINDDGGLEKEADVMGSKALQMESDESTLEFLDNSPKTVAQTKIPEMTGSSPNGHLVKQMQQIINPQPAIQRVVSPILYPQKGGVLLKYYSTHDTKMLFDTYKEALDYDTKLANESGSVFKPFDRVPTNSTYNTDNTESRNAIGTIPQNPHTQSHASLAYSLNKRLDDTGFKERKEQQILNKEDFTSIQQGQTIEKAIISQQRFLIKYMDSKLFRLGNQTFLPHQDADDAFQLLIKFVLKCKEWAQAENLTPAQLESHLKRELNERTIRVVLNSVSPSVRQKQKSEFIDIANIYRLDVTENGINVPEESSYPPDIDSSRHKDKLGLSLDVGDSPELGVKWKRDLRGWFGYEIDNETTYKASKLEKICQPGVAHSELWWANREVKLPGYIAQELSPQHTRSKYVYHITDKESLKSISGGFKSTAARNAGRKVAEETGSTRVYWQKKQNDQITAKIVFLLQDLLLEDGQKIIHLDYFLAARNYIFSTPMGDKSPHAISVLEEMEGVDEDRDRDLIDANDKQEFQAYKTHTSGELQALRKLLQQKPTGKSQSVSKRSPQWQDAAKKICAQENHYLTRLAKNYKMAKNAIEEMVTSQHVYVFKIEGVKDAWIKYAPLKTDPVLIRIPIEAFEFLSKDTQESVGFRSRNEISGKYIEYFDGSWKPLPQ